MGEMGTQRGQGECWSRADLFTRRMRGWRGGRWDEGDFQGWTGRLARCSSKSWAWPDAIRLLDNCATIGLKASLSKIGAVEWNTGEGHPRPTPDAHTPADNHTRARALFTNVVKCFPERLRPCKRLCHSFLVWCAPPPPPSRSQMTVGHKRIRGGQER